MKITRTDAIKILGRITDKEDPYWDYITEEYYDEENDSWPTISDVLEALGLSEEEIKSIF